RRPLATPVKEERAVRSLRSTARSVLDGLWHNGGREEDGLQRIMGSQDGGWVGMGRSRLGAGARRDAAGGTPVRRMPLAGRMPGHTPIRRWTARAGGMSRRTGMHRDKTCERFAF